MQADGITLILIGSIIFLVGAMVGAAAFWTIFKNWLKKVYR